MTLIYDLKACPASFTKCTLWIDYEKDKAKGEKYMVHTRILHIGYDFNQGLHCFSF